MRPPIVILAGGKGTRLLPLTKSCPKPMIPIRGRPFLALLVQKYRKEGFENIIISTNYLADQIESYDFGPGVIFRRDHRPGAYGWFYNAVLHPDTWVVNGDTWIFDPLPPVEDPTILAAAGTDAGAQYTAFGKIKVHPVSGFIDIGTPEGLEAFKKYADEHEL